MWLLITISCTHSCNSMYTIVAISCTRYCNSSYIHYVAIVAISCTHPCNSRGNSRTAQTTSSSKGWAHQSPVCTATPAWNTCPPEQAWGPLYTKNPQGVHWCPLPPRPLHRNSCVWSSAVPHPARTTAVSEQHRKRGNATKLEYPTILGENY